MSQEKVLDTEKERVANVKLAGDGQGGKWGSAVPAELDPELPGWLNRWGWRSGDKASGEPCEAGRDQILQGL